jgi:HlyD family secretion protein
MNKKLRVIATAVLLPVAATSAWFYHRADAHEASSYRFATVERGSLKATVSATGALSAVRTVQVGTQVSGQVSAIYVDFNDKVKKGELLARIDPTLQQQAVQDAQASLARVDAQNAQAKAEYDREKSLFDQKIITESEFQTALTNYTVGQANVRSAQIALDKARQNLSYTNIYSPIDGVIVERDVDVGQTVAASLSAPQLFLIANDLSQMQILASVDESDIGQVKEGQQVSFSVQSYANETFSGAVKQVRLQSKTTDNVVNYTVVVGVDNPNGKLLPGMTATVAFTTGGADNVMLLPNAALRFRPTPEMLAQIKPDSTARGDSTARRRWRDSTGASGGNGAPSDSARAAFVARMRSANGGQGFGGGQGGGATGGVRPRSNVATLYYVDSTGKLAAMRVRTGVSDGQKTELQSQRLKEGMQVIIGVTNGAAASATTSNSRSTTTTNPLSPQGPRRGPGGPGGF